MVKKQWLVLVAALALGLALAAVAWAWTSGPSVSGGKNPLRSFRATLTGVCTTSPSVCKPGRQQVFEVPQGQTLVITDLMRFCPPPSAQCLDPASGCSSWYCEANQFTSGKACLLADGAALWCLNDMVTSVGTVHADRDLGTGIPIPAGSKVELLWWPEKSATVVATGYLMRN
jgi:hypothetical protein